MCSLLVTLVKLGKKYDYDDNMTIQDNFLHRKDIFLTKYCAYIDCDYEKNTQY
jgi:hypothetical protein